MLGDGVACKGQCPVCGRWVDLTWQRGGDVDKCPCGVEAVLVIVTKDMVRWYWRDPLDLPAPAGHEAPARREAPEVGRPVQAQLF